MSALPVATLVSVLAAVSPAAAQELYTYTNPDVGFTIGLPSDGFEVERETEGRLQLVEAGGSAQLDVYGVHNPDTQSIGEFQAMVEAADSSRRITYRAGGNSWFVLSGYLEGEAEPTIFYAKFMVNAAGTAMSAFEISYPESRRASFDPLVERIEDSLTAPRRNR